jgi:glycerol-3-phosphate cytidylyltransferase
MKKVGITCSTFDLLHAGHVAMLREAKSACDYLICALQVDPSVDRPEKNKPVQNIVERQAQLAAIKYVDEILVYSTEDELLDILGIGIKSLRVRTCVDKET